MKNLLLILITLCIGAATNAQDTRKIEISKSVITEFQKKEYTKIVLTFDETMKNALPAEKLKQVWEGLIAQCGSYQKYTAITEGKIQDYDIVYVLCHFEKVNLKMKLVFNSQNKVAGMFFIPENQQ